MLGSLITRDMASDRTYAGAPATDMTDKFGPPIVPTSLAFRREYLAERLETFGKEHNVDIWRHVGIIETDAERLPDGKIYFNIQHRTYNKTAFRLEHTLLRFLLPKAKFTPVGLIY